MEIFRINTENKTIYEGFLNSILRLNSSELDFEKKEYIAAAKNSELAGFIAVDFTEDNYSVLECIYVLEQYRYQGIGSALLTAAEFMCTVSGYDSLSLVCNSSGISGRNVYGSSKGELCDFFEKRGYLTETVEMPEPVNLVVLMGSKSFI